MKEESSGVQARCSPHGVGLPEPCLSRTQNWQGLKTSFCTAGWGLGQPPRLPSLCWGVGLRVASGPLSTAPSPGHPLPTRRAAAGSRHPSIVPLGPPPSQSPPWALSPPLSIGVPVGLGMLTFEDRDVDGGPQAGQPCPRVPVAHVGAQARGSGGPGWTAALHAWPAGQPQATPGPSRQCQEQQEGRGHHPGQGLGLGRKGGGGWERKAGSGGLALLSPQCPLRQPGSAPVWGRQLGTQGATWVGRDS